MKPSLHLFIRRSHRQKPDPISASYVRFTAFSLGYVAIALVLLSGLPKQYEDSRKPASQREGRELAPDPRPNADLGQPAPGLRIKFPR